MPANKLKIMVLAGGPDRERPVSLQSGREVARALEMAGHDVRMSDAMPDDLAFVDAFERWGGDVIFPAMHGPWGEGGPLQRILEARGLRFVGCDSATAALCMDKVLTKIALQKAGLPTPGFELLAAEDTRTLAPPLVVKPPCEGSSIDLVICRDEAAADDARAQLHARHPRLLLESFVTGMELTVGVIAAQGPGAPGGYVALPPIQIVPATEFYDYEAKYIRNDTQYRFDVDLPPERINSIKQAALSAFFALGCRHLSRVDFIVDREHRPWILEVNTLPGFTTHSLLPMAAARTGLDMAKLVDQLVQAAL